MQITASLRVMMFSAAPEMPSSRKRTTMAVEISKSMGSSFEMVDFWMRTGLMRAAMPIRSRILMILLPITLPSSMSVLPSIKEEIETASSGAPVPIATIVRPINCFDTLKFEATLEAPETNQSAPLIKRMKPTTRIVICNAISIFLFFD